MVYKFLSTLLRKKGFTTSKLQERYIQDGFCNVPSNLKDELLHLGSEYIFRLKTRLLEMISLYGGVYKPRGQTRGVAQMITTINNSYLVKVSKWGEGVKIAQNFVHVVCTHPLSGIAELRSLDLHILNGAAAHSNLVTLAEILQQQMPTGKPK